MSKQPKRARLTDRKRDAILEAAVIVFQENGYDRAKVDRIAEVASVSKRTLYNHFSSKEELFGAIVIQMKQQAGDLNEFPFRPDQPIKDQMTQICRQIVQMITAEDFLALARVIVSRFLQSPELAKQAFQDEPVCHDAIVQWIEGAIENGEFDAVDPDLVTKVLMGLLKEFFFWPVLIAGHPELDQDEGEKVIAEIVELICCRFGVSKK